MRRLITTVISLAMILGACGGDDSDAAAVLADYLEVWNSEDAEAVMEFWAEDAVLDGHPTPASDGLQEGKSEILTIEGQMNGFQGSTGMMEFLNMEGSGNTATFDSIFHNAQGECFSSGGHDVTVADDKITLWVWGDTDTDLC